jgi:hypothetical protein
MKHEVLKPIQKEWLGWLIKDEWDWMIRTKVQASNHRQQLAWTYTSGVYDASTKGLLTYILEEFNEDSQVKHRWYLKKEWDKANVI